MLLVLQAWWTRVHDMWQYGGETDECGYMHEALELESFEPERTDYYISTCRCAVALCMNIPYKP